VIDEVQDNQPHESFSADQPAANEGAHVPAVSTDLEYSPDQNSTNPASTDAVEPTAEPVATSDAGNADAGTVTGSSDDTVVVKTKPRKTKTAAQIQAEADAAEVAPATKQWYILKVATNREDSICDALKRRVAKEGLQDYFGEILVPVEVVTEFKNGKKKNIKRKLYPGYIVVNMAINDDTWYVVRETSGIGDFTGALGRPSPMSAGDIAKIIPKTEPGVAEQPKTAIKYKQGDRVRIKEGMFANFEGSIEGIDETNGRVTVIVNIFGRSTPVDIEYWLVESVD
jgi:transcription termination/antitermination protein NusG